MAFQNNRHGAFTVNGNMNNQRYQNKIGEINVTKPSTSYSSPGNTFGNQSILLRNENRAEIKPENTAKAMGNANGNVFKQKKNDGSEHRIFTGTAERIIKWNKVYKDFCYYEVISSVISIQEGNIRLQKIMLLKDRKGPILQVVHYTNDRINIEDFHVGQMLRCVGRMVGPNTLHAVSIRTATSDEVANLPRLCYICDHAIAKSV